MLHRARVTRPQVKDSWDMAFIRNEGMEAGLEPVRSASVQVASAHVANVRKRRPTGKRGGT